MKIDKGVSVPPGIYSGRGRPEKYPFSDMEIGDSLFEEIYLEYRKIRTAATKHGIKYGKKFVGRAVDGGYRIWRTK